MPNISHVTPYILAMAALLGSVSAFDDGTTKAPKRQSVGIIVPLVTFSSVGIICILIFSFVRHIFPDVYMPRRVLRRGAPPRIQKGVLSWIPVLWYTPESFLINTVGLDGIMLLRFLKMGTVLFSLLSIPGLFILGPINFFASPKAINDLSIYELEAVLIPALSVDNVPNQSNFLRVHLGFTWLFSIIVLSFLISYYRDFVQLKYQYEEHVLRTTNMSKIEMRSIMVFGIPRNMRNEVDLASYFDNLGIGRVENAVIFRRWSALQNAVAQRGYYLTQLERLYMDVVKKITRGRTWLDQFWSLFFQVSYSRDAEQILPGNLNSPHERTSLLPTQRHTTVADVSDPGVAEMITRLDTLNPTQRPKHRIGFMGLFGPYVDSADFYLRKFTEFDRHVTRLRRMPDDSAPTAVGVVTFETSESATIASQAVLHRKPFALMTRMAPEPRDMYWPNLSARTAHNYTKFFRSLIVMACMFLLVFFSAAVVSFIIFVTNINTLIVYFPALADILRDLPDTWVQVIMGVLSTTLVSAYTSSLPAVLMILCQLQGLEAESWIEQSLLGKYFFYHIWNNLFLVVFTPTITEIIPNPQKIIELLGRMVPKSSTFLINYVILQGAAVGPAQLLLAGPLILTWIIRLSPFSRSTPRQISDAYYPSILNRINYGIVYPIPILVFIIGLTYATISPLVLPFCACFFAIAYLVYKYLLLYVHLPRYESKGTAAPLAVNRCLGGLILMQLTMMGVLALKSLEPSNSDSLAPLESEITSFNIEASAKGPGGLPWSGYAQMVFGVTPLIILTLFVYSWLAQGYGRQIRHIPLEVLGRVSREFSSRLQAQRQTGTSSDANGTPAFEGKAQELDDMANAERPQEPGSSNSPLKRYASLSQSSRSSRPSRTVSQISTRVSGLNQDGRQTPPDASQRDGNHSTPAYPDTPDDTLSPFQTGDEFDGPARVLFSQPSDRLLEASLRPELQTREDVQDRIYLSSHLEPPMTRVYGILDAPIEAACAVIKRGDETELLMQDPLETEDMHTLNEDDMQLHTYMHPALIGKLPMAWFPSSASARASQDARLDQARKQRQAWRRLVGQQQIGVRVAVDEANERNGTHATSLGSIVEDFQHVLDDDGERTFVARVRGFIDGLTSWTHFVIS